MPGQTFPIEILLPILVRLFPELVSSPVVRGLVIPLINVDPTAEEELARKLQRKVKFPRVTGDSSRVVKIADAIACVEKVIGDGKLQSLGMIGLARQLLNQATGDSPIGTAIVDCIRSKALQQKNRKVGGVMDIRAQLEAPYYKESARFRVGRLHPFLGQIQREPGNSYPRDV